jgi:hypothetical protein
VSYSPGLLGLARVDYVDRRSKKTLQTDELTLWLPLSGELLETDWRQAEQLELEERDLERRPLESAAWEPIPAVAGKASSYGKWKRQLADHLYRSCQLELFKSPTFKEISAPGESEREFRVRLAEAAREQRDLQVAKLRKRYASKTKTLEERIRRALQRVQREKEQAKQQKLKTALSVGMTLLSAFTGRKRLSTTTLSRAQSAMRGVGRSAGESQDVEQAEDTVEALTLELEELKHELEAEIQKLDDRFDPATEKLENRPVRPRKADVEVRLLALGWSPQPE